MKIHYIAMRLVKTVLVAIAVVLLSFFLIRLAPGDAATVMAGQAGYADEAYMKSLRAEYGLDQPLPVQLWKYMDAVAHGDLGMSYVRRQPVFGRLPVLRHQDDGGLDGGQQRQEKIEQDKRIRVKSLGQHGRIDANPRHDEYAKDNEKTP